MSCLFNSISFHISEPSNTIRNKICDYLKQNKKIMDGISTKDVLKFESSNYITEMRKSTTWGGAIEIQCACNIWKVRIIVEDIRKKKNIKIIEFLPSNSTYTKTINLKWSGGHYEPR
jgi:hypothetical protein